MKLIDTHAHLNFSDYDNDRKKVIENSLKNEVFMINVGTNYNSSKFAVEIAKNYENGVYASIGLHALNIGRGNEEKNTAGFKPEDVSEQEFDSKLYKKLAESKKVVAIGEVGLDYYYKPKTNKKLAEMKEKQLAILKKEMDLAHALDLPIIFHCRMAHDDLIQLLKKESKKGKKIKGVIHCFTATPDQMKQYLEFGFCIGLNGIIFKMNLDEQIKSCPKERIVVETDCPFLTPPPLTGRNEPQYLTYVVDRVALIRSESAKEVASYSTANAKQLFGI